MAANQVYMDIPAVRGYAEKFGQIGDVLQQVNKMLEVLATTLKTTAFVGLVGGAVVLAVIETIKPYVERMAKKCAELKEDVGKSVDAYERGDATGATRFY